MDKLLEEIIEIVKDCGLFILNADRRKNHIYSKEGHGNFVTEYDKKVQSMLKKELLALLPGASFIGEEDDNEVNHDKVCSGYAFVVDPIDGTTNFIKDYKASSISVALLKNGEQYMGVVYNPYLDEMFSAMKGQGAFLNGKPIHVSKAPLSDGLTIIGTAPYYPELHEKTFRLAYEYFKKSVDIRRGGSAAIDLCNLAAGRAEFFFELRLQPWDFAAAGLIVKEAGGVVKTEEGEDPLPDRPNSIFASNGVEEP